MFVRISYLLGGLAFFCAATIGAGLAEPGLPRVVPEVAVIDQVEFIPLTPFAEIAGATIRTDALSGTVTLTRGTHQFNCTPGKKTASDGVREIVLPQAPVAQGGELYVPLRALVTALGGQEALDFDLSRGMARVTFPDHTTAEKFSRHVLNSVAELAHATSEVYAAHPDGSGLRRLTYAFSASGTYSLALSPDSQSLLYCRDGDIIRHTLESRREATLLQGNRQNGYYARQCAFTPDGTGILFAAFVNGRGRSIMRMDLDGQHIRSLITQGSQFAMLPKGKGMAYATDGGWNSIGHIFLADTDGGNARQLADAGARCFGLRCSDNGALLVATLLYFLGPANGNARKISIVSYVLSGENAGKCYQPATEQRTAQMPEKYFMDVSTDGQYILYSVPGEQPGYGIMRYDLSDARQAPLQHDDHDLHFAPVGRQLLFTRGGATYSMTLDTFAITPSPTAPAAGLLTKDGQYALFLRQPE